ncbi:MAG: hypothetical protein ACFCAD_08320 [Pleurocapsa sp.]
MNKIITTIAIAFWIVIVLLPTPAIADKFETNTSNNLQRAAQKVIEDDSAKEQFGKSANGDRLLDNAKAKASKKLTDLAHTEDTENLPESKKLFLKNLTK